MGDRSSVAPARLRYPEERPDGHRPDERAVIGFTPSASTPSRPRAAARAAAPESGPASSAAAPTVPGKTTDPPPADPLRAEAPDPDSFAHNSGWRASRSRPRTS